MTELKDKLQMYDSQVRHIYIKKNSIACCLTTKPTWMTGKHDTTDLENVEVDEDYLYLVVITAIGK